MGRIIKIRKSARGQRWCDAKAARGELCDCMWCVHDRMKANEGNRQVFGDY